MLIRGQFKWQIHDPNPALVASPLHNCAFSKRSSTLTAAAIPSFPQNLSLFRVSPHLL